MTRMLLFSAATSVLFITDVTGAAKDTGINCADDDSDLCNYIRAAFDGNAEALTLLTGDAGRTTRNFLSKVNQLLGKFFAEQMTTEKLYKVLKKALKRELFALVAMKTECLLKSNNAAMCAIIYGDITFAIRKLLLAVMEVEKSQAKNIRIRELVEGLPASVGNTTDTNERDEKVLFTGKQVLLLIRGIDSFNSSFFTDSFPSK